MLSWLVFKIENEKIKLMFTKMILHGRMEIGELKGRFGIVIAILLNALSLSLKAQSDNCSGAAAISVTTSYAPQSYDLSTCLNNDGPALYTGTSFRDGWFNFTTGNNATAVLITAIGTTSPPIAISTYLNCSNLVAQSSIVPNSKTAILYASVTPNTNYLLRISRTSTGNTLGNAGTICVQSIDAVVATYTSSDLSTEYIASEPNTNSSASCPGNLSLQIPAGNAITNVSTLYHIRALAPGTMMQQRSMLYSPTISAGESTVTAGTSTGSNIEKYERHNLTFAEGATGNIQFQLKTWRTAEGSGCNTTYNKVNNNTWTVVAFYSPSSSCPSPILNTFETLSFNTNSASIEWGEPLTPPTEGYEYIVSTSNTTPITSGTPLLSGTQINVSSLEAGTNYYLFVRGKCSTIDFGTWTGPYHFNTAVCEASAQCNYQLQMTNVTPSGWNGTVIGFRQNGVVVATATLSSGSNGNLSIPLCENLSTEVFVQHIGSYSDEIGFVLYNAAGNIEHTLTSGNALTLNSVLDSFTSSCPDCNSPGSVMVSYPGSSSINIQWTAPNPAPASGYEYVVSTNSSYPIGSGTAVSSGTSVLVSGLTTSTTYYVFVRSICAPNIPSGWTGPLAIITSCAESTLTVHEGLNSSAPNCWETQIVVDGSNQSGISPELQYVTSSNNPSGLSAFEGSGFLKFNSYNCDNGDQVRLISTPFETTGILSSEVSFIWSHDPDFSLSNDGIQVQYSFDKVNWINVGSFISRFSSGQTGWFPKVVTLPNQVNSQPHVYVAFLFAGDGGNDCYIDNVILRATPECKEPTNIKAAHLTQNFCRMEWTASTSSPSNGYFWELRTSGAAGSGAAGLAANGNTATNILFTEINGLSGLTNYTFYIKSDCGAAESEWSWPYTFRTVAAVINTFPYDETYEISSSTRAGWQNEYTFGNWNWTYASGAGGGDITTAHTGAQNARFRSTTDIIYTTKLVSPPLDLTTMPSGARLKFWYANQNWSGRQNELRVYYKTTYGDTWALIPGAVYNTNQNSWTEVSLTLPETGSDYYIGFEGLNKNSRGIVIDDLRIEPLECPIPSTNAVVGQNSAFIYWQLATDPSLVSFEWEVRTAGAAGSGSLGLKSSGSTLPGVLGRNVSDLSANTTYYLYVRTRCAQDDYSLWSLATMFTTTNITPPANDHFASAIALNSTNYMYPNCVSINGTTVGATPFFHQDYNDVWYRFTAVSNGVSINLTNAGFDGAIVLMDENKNIINTENITNTEQPEILNADNLSTGSIYYVAIANYRPAETTDGNFTFCLKQLRQANTASGTYNLCATLKSISTGASSYTFTFTPTGSTPGTATSVTTNGIIGVLGMPQLNLAWGGTYSVKVDATYNIANGLGSIETIWVPGVMISTITIEAAPLAQLNPNQSCANNITLYRNSNILAHGVNQGYICGIVNYTVEFTRVSDCAGNNPNSGSTFMVNTLGSLSLNYAFNSGGVTSTGNAHAGYWQVRWRPNPQYGVGQFGPAHVIRVYNTSSSNQGMAEYSSSELLSNIESSLTTSVYPNPNTGEQLNINIDGGNNSLCSIKLIDAMGKLVYQSQYLLNDQYAVQVNFSERLPAGLYVIEYNIAGVVKKDRLIVIK